MNNKVILSHSGKQHSYHVAKALNDLGCLEKFYTSAYITSGYIQEQLRKSGDQYWSRRFVEGLPGNKVESNWHFEFKEIMYSKLFGQSEKTLRTVYQRDINFDRYMASKMSKIKGDIFWGYQGSSFQSLHAARRQNKFSICELATAHAPAAKRILGEEQLLHPEWADSFDNLVFPSEYYSRLFEEPHLADIVIGASSFTLQTLKQEGVPESKLRYLPLGFEMERIPFTEKPRDPKRPLQLLYAGRITQRKGVKYLLEAMKQFSSKEVELHMIGNIHGSGKGMKEYEGCFTLHPAISQYELFKRYQDFDAFILPSVFEGFGLVIVEAMAAGLPVITTAHTMGPELIENDSNGYVIPIRDPLAIANAIEKLINKTPEALSAMQRNARLSALSFSWDAYTLRLKAFLETDLFN